jgi:hypothetical protein
VLDTPANIGTEIGSRAFVAVAAAESVIMLPGTADVAVNDVELLVRFAACDSVRVPDPTDAIVVPDKMPLPETVSPATRPGTLDISVTVVLPIVVDPRNDTVDPIDKTVVFAGMPLPVTVSPATRPETGNAVVTIWLFAVVVPWNGAVIVAVNGSVHDGTVVPMPSAVAAEGGDGILVGNVIGINVS